MQRPASFAPTSPESAVATVRTDQSLSRDPNTMSRPTVEPVTEDLLPEFCAFLHAHLDASRSPEVWARSLRTHWGGERPNFGFCLRSEGKIVGGIGAYYATRTLRGREEKVCNITSWCVLDTYRQQSMRLAMALVGQPGYHYTDFSPTAVVGGTLKFLKFKALDERQVFAFNLPWMSFTPVLDTPDAIEAALSGDALRVYRDHAAFPWLHHVVIGRRGEQPCHVIYKPEHYSKVPCAYVVHVSDPDSLRRRFRAFASYLLMRGLLGTRAELRMLKFQPWPSRMLSGFNARVYRSDTLTDDDIDYLYSEAVAIDL